MARPDSKSLLQRMTSGRGATVVHATPPPTEPEQPSSEPATPVEAVATGLKEKAAPTIPPPPLQSGPEEERPDQPPMSMEARNLLSKLGGGTIPVPTERGVPVSLRLDKQLDTYLRGKVLDQRRTNQRPQRGQAAAGARPHPPRPTLVGAIREALKGSVPPEVLTEVMAQAKPLLNTRRATFGTVRTNVEVNAQVLVDVDRQRDQFSTSESMLSQAAVIEIRLLLWAVSQDDWPNQ